jgi:hypothetical protein
MTFVSLCGARPFHQGRPRACDRRHFAGTHAAESTRCAKLVADAKVTPDN